MHYTDNYPKTVIHKGREPCVPGAECSFYLLSSPPARWSSIAGFVLASKWEFYSVSVRKLCSVCEKLLLSENLKQCTENRI